MQTAILGMGKYLIFSFNIQRKIRFAASFEKLGYKSFQKRVWPDKYQKSAKAQIFIYDDIQLIFWG